MTVKMEVLTMRRSDMRMRFQCSIAPKGRPNHLYREGDRNAVRQVAML
jgi:hypothetical protein